MLNFCCSNSNLGFFQNPLIFAQNFKFLAVDLGHAFNLFELDGVSIIKAVSFFFVQVYDGLLLLGDSSNMNHFGLLSSQVKDFMGLSKIDECVPIEAKISG